MYTGNILKAFHVKSQGDRLVACHGKSGLESALCPTKCKQTTKHPVAPFKLDRIFSCIETLDKH